MVILGVIPGIWETLSSCPVVNIWTKAGKDDGGRPAEIVAALILDGNSLDSFKLKIATPFLH